MRNHLWFFYKKILEFSQKSLSMQKMLISSFSDLIDPWALKGKNKEILWIENFFPGSEIFKFCKSQDLNERCYLVFWKKEEKKNWVWLKNFFGEKFSKTWTYLRVAKTFGSEESASFLFKNWQKIKIFMISFLSLWEKNERRKNFFLIRKFSSKEIYDYVKEYWLKFRGSSKRKTFSSSNRRRKIFLNFFFQNRFELKFSTYDNFLNFNF